VTLFITSRVSATALNPNPWTYVKLQATEHSLGLCFVYTLTVILMLTLTPTLPCPTATFKPAE